MKWFKHISDSIHDPFIFSLMREFGGDGYLVFFGVLEIYSREFSTENGWVLHESLSYFCHNLLISPKKFKNILSKITKWDVSYQQDTVSIFIPKYKELLDETTLKKLREHENSIRSRSGIVPKKGPTDKEEDKEEDKDLKAESVLPVDNLDQNQESDHLPPFYQNLKSVIQEINTAYESPHDQRMAMKFIEGNYRNKNPDAVIHCLKSLLKAKANGTEIGNIEAYLKAAMRMENQNYNARDHDRRTEDLKGPPTPKGLQAMKSIMTGMGI